MKIAFLIFPFDLQTGGAEKQMQIASKLFQNLDHEINFIYKWDGNFITRQAGTTPQRIMNSSRGFFSKFWPLTLFKEIKKGKYDLVISRTGMVVPFFSNLLSNVLGYKTVYWCSSNLELIQPKRIPRSLLLYRYRTNNPIIKYSFWKLFGLVIKMSSMVIFQTTEQKNIGFRNFSINSHMVIPNSISAEEFNYQRRDYSKIKEKRIIWIGRFSIVKNPQKFAEIAKLNSDLDVIFTMIGSGEQYNNLIKFKKLNNLERLEILNEEDRENVIKLLETSICSINTSYIEGFPNTILESWLYNVFVISMRADIDNKLESGDFGLLIKHNHLIRNTIQKILHDMENTDYRSKLEVISQKILDEYSIIKYGTNLTKMLNQLSSIA
ncbi:MAG: hypothetical protein HeimC2_17990 [Candidatus Heimdallarchaeota archaeon LC_2]|nr:MAG: hypothetical protein HeimC2_17990 [Candidatus Heimdallarchaeota archaeon LC_2]